MRTCVVGVGALGSAIVECLLSSGFPPSNLLLVERRSESAGLGHPNTQCGIGERFGCRVITAADSLSESFSPEVLFITVKPQDFTKACDTIRPLITPNTLVISCMAGTPTSALSQTLQHQAIIRAMPNLGTVIRESATVYYATAQLSHEQVAAGESVLSTLGKTWRVADEALLNTATAIAGSGPAYISWLAEIMQQEAARLGFAAPDCRELVLQTLRATVEYLQHSQLPFEALRNKVTSRGGTTAAALEVLSHRKAQEAFQEAIDAAFLRSVELGTLPRS